MSGATRSPRPDPGQVYATSTGAMVSTSHPLATEAALAVLRRGGNAVDAYIAAAAVQTVVEPHMTTLAGQFGVTFCDGGGRTRSVGGGFALPKSEDANFEGVDYWNGRVVMVPGWVNGAWAASRELGRLAWADLFTDAIAIARDGYVVDERLWGTMYVNRQMVARFPDGRAIWQPDGRWICVGETLRQAAIARTLEGIAAQGPTYVHRGPWARAFVDAVRACGGRMTLDDVEAHEGVSYSMALEPVTTYQGFDVVAPGALSGICLNVCEAAGFASRPQPTESAETLYLQMRVLEEAWHAGLAYTPDNHDRLVSKDHAEQLWKAASTQPPRPYPGIAPGTCGIVIADTDGGMALGTHTSSSTGWGVGIVVDGVYSNRILVYHRPVPGGVTTCHMLLRDGKPVLGVASPMNGFFTTIIQNTLNVIDWGIGLDSSVRRPRFGGPFPADLPVIVEADFGEEILRGLDERGMPYTRVSPWEPTAGNCHAVHIDHASGRLHGASDPRQLGVAAGIDADAS